MQPRLRDFVEKLPFLGYAYFGLGVLCLATFNKSNALAMTVNLLLLLISVLLMFVGYMFGRDRLNPRLFSLAQFLFQMCSMLFAAYIAVSAVDLSNENSSLYRDYWVVYLFAAICSFLYGVYVEIAHRSLSQSFLTFREKFEAKELDFAFPQSRRAKYVGVSAAILLIVVQLVISIQLGAQEAMLFVGFIFSMVSAPFFLCVALSSALVLLGFRKQQK